MTRPRVLKGLPDRMKSLPVDKRGFPIPKFVDWIDGEPDFRVLAPEHFARCLRHRKCWICGEQLGAYASFVIGPMCIINRISSEPPSHRECAQFAAINCPFLSKPLAKRRTAGLPEDRHAPGLMIEHNPGVSCVWTTRTWGTMRVHNGILVQIGEPNDVEFYTEGRRATNAEVHASIAKGWPFLCEAADKDGGDQPKQIRRKRAEAERLVNLAVPP